MRPRGRPPELRDRVRLDVYVDRAEREQLAALAAERGVSVSQLVRSLVAAELEK